MVFILCLTCHQPISECNFIKLQDFSGFLVKMVFSCCVKGCRSESYPGCGVSFHSFPVKEDALQAWLKAIPIKGSTKYKKVCSNHFKSQDIVIQGARMRITANAVPSVLVTVCRVCLAMDVKMYDLKDIELSEMFQNITGIAVTENNHSILERLCWECVGRLKAAAGFRKKALLSDALLQGLATNTGEQIRKNNITSLKENEDYLKSVGSLSTVKVFHIVDIDPENDSVPPVSENNDTEIVQKIVRNDSKKESIIEEDNYQMDAEDESMIEVPITTETKSDQIDHVSPNTGEESSNNFLETNPVVTNNVPFREDKINSANSSTLPSCSHIEPKYQILGYLLKTPSDLEDKIKKPVIKTYKKRDSISKIVSINSNEVIRVLKGDAKLKNINVKTGAVSKKTSNLKLVKKSQVKANTLTDEESLSLEDFEF